MKIIVQKRNRVRKTHGGGEGDEKSHPYTQNTHEIKIIKTSAIVIHGNGLQKLHKTKRAHVIGKKKKRCLVMLKTWCKNAWQQIEKECHEKWQKLQRRWNLRHRHHLSRAFE